MPGRRLAEGMMATPASADRNLLFGILALQMDFITRDQLVTGMNGWVLDKTKPLGKILVDQKALSPDDHALLEPLVRRHIEAHQNDPSKSLAAVGPVDAVKELRRRVDDVEVQASLGHVPHTLPSDVDPNATRAVQSLGAVTGASLRFKTLRPHREGGLGQVSVALDEEFKREVALKEIKERYADHDESRGRFILEGEITGQLEHPGIVPVYGAGKYPDGRPFYAMRFIRGESLHEYIKQYYDAKVPLSAAERNVEFRMLLRRFIDVCNAIAYAHHRGVLHRDLKPGNIMLGRYGETLVVDWGLAKHGVKSAEVSTAHPTRHTIQDSDEQLLHPSTFGGMTPTVVGQAIGTPDYMSPEQADGRLEDLGPGTDIYSLGATLYVLLTGKSAFRGSTVEVLAKVRRGEFPSPREANAAVPRSLDAICLKAMALRPADRYASALDLAADIEHWLADEPVSAWKEPWTDRARRWMKRHRALVTGTAAAVVVAVIALGVIAALTELSRRQIAKQEERARENYEIADSLFAVLVEEIQDELGNAANTLDLRRRLLSKPLAQLERLKKSVEDSDTLDHYTVLTHLRMGDVRLLMGALDQARDEFQRGHEMAKQLSDASPSDRQARHDLAMSHDRLGLIALRLAGKAAARDHFQHSTDILKQLTTADRDNPKVRRDLPFVLTKLGDMCRELGDLRAARDHYQEALRHLETADPNDTATRRDLAAAYIGLGDVALQMREFKEAGDFYLKQLAQAKADALADPRNTKWQRLVSILHERLGNVARDERQPKRAITEYQKGLIIRNQLARDDPKDVEKQRELAIFSDRVGDIHMQIKEWVEARKYFEQGRAIRGRLLNDAPEDRRIQRELAISHRQIGNTFRRAAAPAEARKHFALARELVEKLAADRKDITAQVSLARLFDELADCDVQELEFGRALTLLRQAEEILQPLHAAGKLTPEQERFVAALENTFHATTLSENAIKSLDFILKQPAGDVPQLLFNRVKYFLKRGDTAMAEEAITKMAELDDKTGELKYNAACLYGLSCAAAKDDAARERYGKRAIELLRESVQRGFAKLDVVKKDPDLDALRQRDDFRKLIAELEASVPVKPKS